ncbi:MAG: helix-turn-helix transcriptional regulator, partial [Oscillospiraceae bacterium]
MERKSIGSFIAVLRKANGLTQKDLAEKLNVSDKSVSRWERDDGAPDLSLVPVIAEIFGVTCDELLRGERKAATAPSEQQTVDKAYPKTEKQRQRILSVSLSKYRNRSLISASIAIVGLLAAMLCNFGF